MQRVVIDTNVLISALIQRSFPYLIVNSLVFEGKVVVCVSNDVFQEYYDVLNRKKFAKYADFVTSAESLLSIIGRSAKWFNPVVTLNVISDIDDNKFLELAVSCKADFIITGNSNDFTMQSYKKTKIVTPREYWENHLPL